MTADLPAPPALEASNAFYYYADLDAAWAFYRDVLGFETAADYGFAKIMRVAPKSFLTLVNAEDGMHSVDEPKSVTLAVVTEQVEGWYEYLQAQGVPMRGEYNYTEGRPHDGFVAIDPEGYLLEFERFNPHEENVQLMPVLADVEPIGPAGGARPAELQVQATVLWLYYDDVPAALEFYERLLGVDLIVDQGWAKMLEVGPTGFVGLVDGARGLHQATLDKAVTVSFLTPDVEGWFSRVQALGLEFRTPEIGTESDRVSVFVAYDLEGYFLEWDTFLDVDGNERMMEVLR